MQESAVLVTSPEGEMKQRAADVLPTDEHKSLTGQSFNTASVFDSSSIPLPLSSPLSTPPLPPPRVLPALPPSPAVLILRGISGSGKSSIAKQYQSLALTSGTAGATSSSSSTSLTSPARSLICSADAFFLRHGRYVFESKLLPQAHSACLASFLALLASHSPYAILDNTNCQLWEYANHATIAAMMGYAVLIVEVTVQGEEEVRACAERNLHEVAFSGCQSMVDRWEEDSRAVKVRAEWTENDRRRMTQWRQAREQAKLRWQATQQANEQMRQQQQQQQPAQPIQSVQPLQQPQQRQQWAVPPYVHHPPHQHNNHYQPYPQHRPNNNYHPQPPYTHHPHPQPAAAAPSEGYREDRGGDGRGRGRGGWRGGGVGRGARGGYAVQGPLPITSQALAASSTAPHTAPTQTIRWIPKSPTPGATDTDSSAAVNTSSSSTAGASISDVMSTLSISLVSAPSEPNKRYVINDPPT